MGRTRLRGIELAGVQIAVEAPSSFPWDWPEGALAELSCTPAAPEVEVGVRVGAAPDLQDWEPICYGHQGGQLEVGRSGDGWLVALHGHFRRFERVARFDDRFLVGEVVLSPEFASSGECRHPLDGPLLELILLHRVIESGGLVVNGSAGNRDGRAIALLEAAPRGSILQSGDPPLGRGRGGLFTPGRSLALRAGEDSVRVHAMPDARGLDPQPFQARLDALHVLSASGEVYAQPLCEDAAIEAVLPSLHAPLHAPDMTGRLLSNAKRLLSGLRVLELGMPQGAAVTSFAWGERGASLGFAPAPGVV
jgi:hypothetical protein